MTVNTEASDQTFIGNGVSTNFPLTFRFFEDSDLNLIITNTSTGVSTGLTLGADYSVSGAGNASGGSVTLIAGPLPVGFTLYAARILRPVQDVSFINQGKFFPEVHESAFDYLTMLVQQLSTELRTLDSSLRAPFPEVMNPMPRAEERANRLLSFDSDGNPVVVAPADGSSTSLALDLANQTDPSKGAGQVGYNGGTVRDALDEINQDIETISADAVLEDGSGQPVKVSDAVLQLLIRNHIDASWYGLRSGRSPDEQLTGLRNAAAAAKAGGKRLFVPKDTYQLNGGVKIEVPVTFEGGIIDFSGAPASGFADTLACGLLVTGGGFSTLPNLSVDVPQYATQFTLASAPAGLSPGDVICIFNPAASSWSAFRADYYAGEYATVLRVDGATVYLASPLHDSYAASSVAVYKMAPLRGEFDFGGTEIIGPNISITGGSGIRLQNLNRSIISGLIARSANYAQIGVWQSLDVDMYGCEALTLQNTLAGTQYGLSIANAQRVRVHGGTFISERHGITMGGATGVGSIVTRDCHVKGAYIVSRQTGGGDGAADFHGNVENSSYEGCTLVGGATFGGNKNRYRGNKMITGTAGYGFFGSEPKGCDFEFLDNEIDCRVAVPAGRGVFDAITWGPNTTLGGLMNIRGMKIKGADLPGAFPLNIRNYGSEAVNRRLAISDVHIDAPGSAGPYRISNQSGATWASLVQGIVTSTGPESAAVSGVTSSRRTTLSAF